MAGGPDPETAQTDEQLVTQVLAGATNRYAFLVQRYQDALYRYARMLAFDPTVAGDLCQEAFIKAYATLKRCKPRSRFRLFAFEILRGLHRDRLDAPPLEFAEPPAGASRSLRDAIGLLPVPEREAFFLHHVERWSYADIAELTGGGARDVEKSVHAAREKIEAILDLSAGVRDDA